MPPEDVLPAIGRSIGPQHQKTWTPVALPQPPAPPPPGGTPRTVRRHRRLRRAARNVADLLSFKVVRDAQIRKRALAPGLAPGHELPSLIRAAAHVARELPQPPPRPFPGAPGDAAAGPAPPPGFPSAGIDASPRLSDSLLLERRLDRTGSISSISSVALVIQSITPRAVDPAELRRIRAGNYGHRRSHYQGYKLSPSASMDSLASDSDGDRRPGDVRYVPPRVNSFRFQGRRRPRSSGSAAGAAGRRESRSSTRGRLPSISTKPGAESPAGSRRGRRGTVQSTASRGDDGTLPAVGGASRAGGRRSSRASKASSRRRASSMGRGDGGGDDGDDGDDEDSSWEGEMDAGPGLAEIPASEQDRERVKQQAGDGGSDTLSDLGENVGPRMAADALAYERPEDPGALADDEDDIPSPVLSVVGEQDRDADGFPVFAESDREREELRSPSPSPSERKRRRKRKPRSSALQEESEGMTARRISVSEPNPAANHSDMVDSLTCLPSGDAVLVCTRDEAVQVRDTTTFSIRHEFELSDIRRDAEYRAVRMSRSAHVPPMRMALYSAQHEMVVVVSFDGRVSCIPFVDVPITTTAEGTLGVSRAPAPVQQRVPAHEHQVERHLICATLATYPVTREETLVVGDTEGRVFGYDLKTFVPVFKAVHHTGWVTAVKGIPTIGLVTTGADGLMVVGDSLRWDSHGFKFVGHSKGITSLVASHLFAATGGLDGRILIWKYTQARPRYRLTGHHSPVVAITLNEPGSQLFSVSADKIIKVWDTRVFRCIQTVTDTWAHTPLDRVTAMAFEGVQINALITAGSQFRAWPVHKEMAASKVAAHSTPVVTVAYAAGPRALVTVDSGGSVRVWSLDTGRLRFEFALDHSDAVVSACLDERAHFLYSQARNGRVSVNVLRTGELVIECLPKLRPDGEPIVARQLCAVPSAVGFPHGVAGVDSEYGGGVVLLPSAWTEDGEPFRPSKPVSATCTVVGMPTDDEPSRVLQSFAFQMPDQLLAVAASTHTLSYWRLPLATGVDADDPERTETMCSASDEPDADLSRISGFDKVCMLPTKHMMVLASHSGALFVSGSFSGAAERTAGAEVQVMRFGEAAYGSGEMISDAEDTRLLVSDFYGDLWFYDISEWSPFMSMDQLDPPLVRRTTAHEGGVRITSLGRTRAPSLFVVGLKSGAVSLWTTDGEPFAVVSEGNTWPAAKIADHEAATVSRFALALENDGLDDDLDDDLVAQDRGLGDARRPADDFHPMDADRWSASSRLGQAPKWYEPADTDDHVRAPKTMALSLSLKGEELPDVEPN